MQFTVEVRWDTAWCDETVYVRETHIDAGFEGPDQFVARVGRCRLVMDNASQRFSPLVENGPLYGLLLPRKEVRVTASDGINNWYLFRGFIESINPDAGAYSERLCVIECVDALAILAQQTVGTVEYEPTKSVYYAVHDVVAAAYTPPSTDYGDNGDVLTHYGRTWLPEQTTVKAALAEICAAVYGRFWVSRDGVPTYSSRDDLQNASWAPALTLSGSEVIGSLETRLSVERVVNRALVTVYPVETIAAIQTIWKSRSTLRLAPGQARVLYALFRDSYGERCGAVNVAAPVATTDYTVNDKSDGTGFDYTNDPAFSISTETEATRMKVTLGNTAIGPLYMTLLQVRGKPIVTYDPVTLVVEDAGSQADYEVRTLALELPMQADEAFGQAYAEYLISRFSTPQLVAENLAVKNEAVLNGVNVFSVEIGDTVRLTDEQTGLAGALHRVIGVEYFIPPTGFEVTWRLERADEVAYWLLGVENFGELGEATRLGF